jgi:cellobiose-specific phosphotransferase system component IIA
MAYAILRIENHTANGSLGAMTKHNKREIEVPNCNPELTQNNIERIGTGDYLADVNKVLEEQQPLKQKNNIKAVEHLMTASPEWWEESRPEWKTEFIKKAEEFLQEFYGPDSKISSFSIHLDESTPHIHAFVVPMRKSKLKGGREVLRLGAKQYTGSPELLSKMQDDYALKMKSIGLERGVRKSKAKHQSIRKLYGHIDQFEYALEDKPLNPPVIREPFPLNPFKRDEWLETVNKQLREDNNKNLQELKIMAEDKSFLNVKQLLEVQKLENLKRQLKEDVESIILVKYEASRDKAKALSDLKKKYLTDRNELIEQARAKISETHKKWEEVTTNNNSLKKNLTAVKQELSETEMEAQSSEHLLKEEIEDLKISENARKSDLKAMLNGKLDPARIDELKRMFDKEERDLRKQITPKPSKGMSM